MILMHLKEFKSLKFKIGLDKRTEKVYLKIPKNQPLFSLRQRRKGQNMLTTFRITKMQI